jgi:hypothetical protein
MMVLAQRAAIQYLVYCKMAAALLPILIAKEEGKLPVGSACMSLGMCKQNLTSSPDMVSGGCPRCFASATNTALQRVCFPNSP